MTLLLSWALALTSSVPTSSGTASRAWRPSESNFVFPENAEEWSASLAQHLAGKEFGIALAGGGARGLALGHGILREMREAGLLEKAKYLSVTSGSVWLGIPFYYQTLDSLETYLGRTLPFDQMLPKTLLQETGTPEHRRSQRGTGISRLSELREYPKGHEPKRPRLRRLNASDNLTAASMLDCPTDEGWCACMVSRFPGSAYQLWPLFSASIFLHPFELAGYDSVHCHESQLERMKKQFPSKTIYTAKDVSRKLPFLLSQSAILAPYTGLETKDSLRTFPLEQTPLYTGTVPAYSKNQSKIGHGLGDLLLEPFAWDSKMLNPWNESNPELSVQLNRGWVNFGDLATWQGVATAYVADFQIRTWADRIPHCLIAEGEKLLPHAEIWSPLDLDANAVPVSYEQAVGDAGIYDDVGHIPLLRRKVMKMAIFTSEAIHMDLCQMTYVLAAFGQPGCLDPPNPPGASNPKMEAGTLTVFEPSEFPTFWSQVQSALQRNESAVIRGRYTVVDNEYLAIKGGWKVDIVWVIIFPSKTFRQSLPKETQTMLPSYFPNDFAAEMTSRLEMTVASQYGSWLQRSVTKEIEEMLRSSDPTEFII
ncbi:ANK_REP_REGION domain-containing protein [Durusdinium trenchii]|uniref:ANK_REP_REGION domain-containing protein n=1 Tax=Durusdinium trenchii TaxID=1381693 RepID=A0ABP0S9V1_9DINO